MEEVPVDKKIVRIDQIYVVGGSFDDPSDFTNKVNRNLIILQDSNKYCNIKDIKFNIFNDQRYPHSTPIYLAFIVAEVDVDVTPVPEKGKKKKKKKEKKKRK